MKHKIFSSLNFLVLLLFIWACLITYNDYRVRHLYSEMLEDNMDFYVQNVVLNYRLRESYIEIMHLRNTQEQLLDTVKDTNRSFALLIRGEVAN